MTTKRKIIKELSVDVSRRHTVEVKFRPEDSSKIEKLLGMDVPEGYVAGWASTKDMDFAGHMVMPDAFSESISQKGLIGPRGIKLLIGHDRDKPAGVIKNLEYRNGDLWIEAQLNLNISYVRDMYEAAKMNEGFSFSVGFYLEEWTFKEGRDGMDYLEIQKAELEEVSVVPLPMNVNAGMTFIKGITDEETFDTVAELEKALVASGLVKSRNNANRVVRVMKRNVGLLTPSSVPPKNDEPPKPVLAKASADKLFAALAELKSALS